MKTLILLRGLPGSGKTSTASILEAMACAHFNVRTFSADSFFYDENGKYTFDPALLDRAHRECMNAVMNHLSMNAENVTAIVHNTTTTEREVAQYAEIANQFNARLISLVVENRHNGVSVHNVPNHVIERMRNRFSIRV